MPHSPDPDALMMLILNGPLKAMDNEHITLAPVGDGAAEVAEDDGSSIEFALDLDAHIAPGSGRDPDDFYEISAIEPETYFDLPPVFDLAPPSVARSPERAG